MKTWTFKRPDRITLLVALHAVFVILALALVIRQKAEPPHDREKIMVIPVEGVIATESGSLARGQTVASLVETLNRVREQDSVKAVVLRINSPGGSVAAVQDVHSAVLKLREKGKIIVSSFGDVSASGGYYVASAGNHIVCQPGSITGSIGVVMQIPNVQGLLSKVGVSFETIKSGSMKDAGSPFRNMSEAERKYFREVLLDAYDQFFTAVKSGRNMEEKVLRPLADGRIFSGRMALKNKLVDELGGLEEAIEAAKKLSGLEEKKPTIVYHRDKPSLERLFQIFSKSPVEDFAKSTVAGTKILYLQQ